jgi:hypothetical protein
MVVCNLLLQADCEGPYPHLLRCFLRHTEIAGPQLVWLRLELPIAPVQWARCPGAALSQIVVRAGLPRTMPRKPHLCMSRSTVQRATSLPSLRSWFQILSAP